MPGWCLSLFKVPANQPEYLDFTRPFFLDKRINIGKLLLSWNNGLLNAC